MDNIAILGWGSLLWDLDDLEPKVEGEWYVAQGPSLPFEFSRISDKRNKALAVVIDYEHGAACATSHIASIRSDIIEARLDLAARERAQEHHIGYCTSLEDGQEHGDSETVVSVRSWLRETPYNGAVWTHLPRNFEERMGHAFSLTAAVEYLQALPSDSLRDAREYIESAPENVETPLRTLLRDHSWWQAITY